MNAVDRAAAKVVSARCDLCAEPAVAVVLVPSAADACRCELACDRHGEYEPGADRLRLDARGHVDAGAWAQLATRGDFRGIVVLGERLGRERDRKCGEAKRLEELRREERLHEQVFTLVAELGPISRNALQERLHRRRSTISEALRGLAGAGRVSRSPAGYVPGPRAGDPPLVVDAGRGRLTEGRGST